MYGSSLKLEYSNRNHTISTMISRISLVIISVLAIKTACSQDVNVYGTHGDSLTLTCEWAGDSGYTGGNLTWRWGIMFYSMKLSMTPQLAHTLTGRIQRGEGEESQPQVNHYTSYG